METEFKTSGLHGLSGMMSDIFSYLKFALFTKFGLAMTLLCVFIYLFSLWTTGGVKTFGLILSILAFIGFVVMSWMQWFKGTGINKVDEE